MATVQSCNSGYVRSYVKDFLREVKGFIRQRKWKGIRVFNLVSETLTIYMDENLTDSQYDLIEDLLREFIFYHNRGEVTKELFSHNLDILFDVLNRAVFNPQTYLGLNFSPSLYFRYDDEIRKRIVEKFSDSLKLSKLSKRS